MNGSETQPHLGKSSGRRGLLDPPSDSAQFHPLPTALPAPKIRLQPGKKKKACGLQTLNQSVKGLKKTGKKEAGGRKSSCEVFCPPPFWTHRGYQRDSCPPETRPDHEDATAAFREMPPALLTSSKLTHESINPTFFLIFVLFPLFPPICLLILFFFLGLFSCILTSPRMLKLLFLGLVWLFQAALWRVQRRATGTLKTPATQPCLAPLGLS